VRVSVVPVDSDVFGATVLSLDDFDAGADFEAFERDYVARLGPAYVGCKVPFERSDDVVALQRHGFRVVECQLRARVVIRKPYDVARFPYAFERVTTREALAPVLAIAETTFKHDRFSTDAAVPRGVSGARYRRYVEQSFASPSEAVYRLVDPVGGTTVAFKTHRRVGDDEALLLLGGVHADHQMRGLGVVNTMAELEALRRAGVRRATTHITATNYNVINMEIGRLGFDVVGAFAALRKVYAPIPGRG
jgi:hypothetical protein